MSQAWGFLAASSEALLAAFLHLLSAAAYQRHFALFLHSVGVRNSHFICYPLGGWLGIAD